MWNVLFSFACILIGQGFTRDTYSWPCIVLYPLFVRWNFVVCHHVSLTKRVCRRWKKVAEHWSKAALLCLTLSTVHFKQNPTSRRFYWLMETAVACLQVILALTAYSVGHELCGLEFSSAQVSTAKLKATATWPTELLSVWAENELDLQTEVPICAGAAVPIRSIETSTDSQFSVSFLAF
jgi:hypothetical protein